MKWARILKRLGAHSHTPGWSSITRSFATTASSQKDSSRQKDAGRRAHEHQAIGPGLGERGVIA